MSEQDLHAFTADLLRLKAAANVVWFHVPNGEYRSKRTAGKLKRMGVRPGVSDIELVLPPHGRSAFLELKFGRNGLSEAQKVFREQAEAAGALFAVATTPESVEFVLREWGALS